MKSRVFKIGLDLFMLGTLCFAIANCSSGGGGDSKPVQKAGANPADTSNFDADSGLPATGTYQVGNLTCNWAHRDPTDQLSPCNANSQCQKPEAINSASFCRPNNTISSSNNNNTNNNNDARISRRSDPNYTMPNMSDDITPDGTIINTLLVLAGGSAAEAINDNCHYLNPRDKDILTNRDDPDKNHFSVARTFVSNYRAAFNDPRLPEGGDRFEFKFTKEGNLIVRGQSMIGGVNTPKSKIIPPGQYYLRQTDQPNVFILHVDNIQMLGPVNPTFVALQKTLSHEIKKIDEDKLADELHIKNRPWQSKYVGSSVSGATGIQGGDIITKAALDHSNNPNAGNWNDLPQPLSKLAESPAVLGLTIPEFEAILTTHPANTNHVVGSFSAEVDFQSSTFVDTTNDSCKASGSGSFFHLWMKRAN